MRTSLELEVILPPNTYDRHNPAEAFAYKIEREVFCGGTISALYDKIDAHNASPGAIPITKECAALHVLNEFTFHECVKNSLDAHATHIHISVTIASDKMVTVTVSDNGDGTENAMQPYNHRQAFFSSSHKRGEQDQHGGAKKGLAMSAQYLALFNGASNRLETGKSIYYLSGFSVCLISKNEPIQTKWYAYFQQFEHCNRHIQFSADRSPRTQKRNFEHAERALHKRTTKLEVAHLLNAERRPTPLSLDLPATGEPSSQRRMSVSLFRLQPPTPCSSSEDMSRQPSVYEMNELDKDETDNPVCDIKNLFQ